MLGNQILIIVKNLFYLKHFLCSFSVIVSVFICFGMCVPMRRYAHMSLKVLMGAREP